MASVTKRRWKKPDGSYGEGWQVRYIDPATGKRPGKMFELKKDADTFRKKVEREIEDGVHTADGATKTVKVVASEMLKHYEQRHRDGSVGKTYLMFIEMTIRNHIVPCLGGVKISQLSFANVEKYRDNLVQKRLAPISIKNMMGVFKRLEVFAIRRGYTKKAVASEVMSEAPRAKARQVAVPSPSEMQLIMKAALNHGWGITARTDAMMGICVIAASVCGLRYGEIMGLRLADLDFEGRVLQIRQSVTQLGEIKGPKTAAGVRDVPMPAKLVELWRAWIANHYVPNERGLVITSRSGTTIRGSSFSGTYWGPLLKRAGLCHEGGKRFHFHALRHFAASTMIEHNMPLTDVAALLGHAKFDTTLQVYAHPIVRGSRRVDVIDRMSAIHFNPASDAQVTHAALGC